MLCKVLSYEKFVTTVSEQYTSRSIVQNTLEKEMNNNNIFHLLTNTRCTSQYAQCISLPRSEKLRNLTCWMSFVPTEYACKLMLLQNRIPISYWKWDALQLFRSSCWRLCQKVFFENLHKLETLKMTAELNRWLETAKRLRHTLNFINDNVC